MEFLIVDMTSCFVDLRLSGWFTGAITRHNGKADCETFIGFWRSSLQF